MPKAHAIRAGDKIRSNYGVTSGKIGTVVRVHPDPPSITAGFDPKDIDLQDFLVVQKSGLVEFRLAAGEFEPVNKKTITLPSARPKNPREN